jgi:hypothetical protein
MKNTQQLRTKPKNAILWPVRMACSVSAVGEGDPKTSMKEDQGPGMAE